MNLLIDELREKVLTTIYDLGTVNQKLSSDIYNKYKITSTPHDFENEIEQINQKLNVMEEQINDLHCKKKKVINFMELQLKLCDYLSNFSKNRLVNMNISPPSEIILAKNIIEEWNSIDLKTNNECGPSETFKIEMENLDNLFTKKSTGANCYNKNTDGPVSMDSFMNNESVTEEQFNSVPVLIRRRAKLDDINKLYNLICSISKQRNRGLLSIGLCELSSYDLCVSGQTGEAKLASLSYLKKIKINRKDQSIELYQKPKSIKNSKYRMPVCDRKNISQRIKRFNI